MKPESRAALHAPRAGLYAPRRTRRCCLMGVGAVWKCPAHQPPILSQVITGPRSSGKSALLKHVLAQRGPGPMALIDGRSAQLRTPGELCDALTADGGMIQRLKSWLELRDIKSLATTSLPVATSWAGKGFNPADPAVVFKAFESLLAVLSSPRSTATISNVVAAMEKLCAAGKEAAAATGSWPVFVFGKSRMYPSPALRAMP